MTGVTLILAFVVAIVVMIFMISRWHVHPFLAIMFVSIVLGLLAGLPIVDSTAADGTTSPSLVTIIGQGFSGTFTSIGIVIILGALIGSILHVTGSAFILARAVTRLVGERHPVIAMQLMGWVVSIPVFCDSGFVILDPIRRALIRRTGASSVAMTFALSSGLYISHVLIPPTPGPIAAASTLGLGDNLLLIIGLGVLCSIFPLIAGLWYAGYVGRRETPTAEPSVEDMPRLFVQMGDMPCLWRALAPILIPILLMGAASVITMMHLQGTWPDVIRFLGTPVMALAMGTISAIITLAFSHRLHDFYELTEHTLKTVGPILFITGAGGVLSKVVASTDMVNFIEQNADLIGHLGIFVPFLLAAIFKTAVGASTVSLITTSGIVAPLLPALGLDSPMMTALTVMAIGAGSMLVSHANDSYFWVVTKFGGLNPTQGYRVQTLGTLIIALATMLEIFILSLFL